MGELFTSIPSQSLVCSPEQFSQMEIFAERIAKSGLFGISNPAAVVTLMLLCQAEGTNPLLALRRYHIIEGKPAMRADAMQGEFEREGLILWHARTDLEVGATFFRYAKQCDDAARKRAIARYKLKRQILQPDAKASMYDQLADLSTANEETVIWTAEEAWTKGISIGKDGKTMKHNWAAYPRQMLSARVVTEGVRLVWPGLIAGIASVEELQDLPCEATEDNKSAGINYLGMTADALHNELAKEQIKYVSGDKSAMDRMNAIRDRLCDMDGDIAPSIAVVKDVVASPAGTTGAPPKDEVEAENLWMTVKCHIGKASGPILDRTLSELFVQSKLNRAIKMLDVIESSPLVKNPNTLQDHAFVAALQCAKAFIEERKTREGGEPSKPACASDQGEQTQTNSAQSTVDIPPKPRNNAEAKSDPSPSAIDWRSEPIYLPQSKKGHGRPLGEIPPHLLQRLESEIIAHYVENAGDKASHFSKALAACKRECGIGDPFGKVLSMVQARLPDTGMDDKSFCQALTSSFKFPEVARGLSDHSIENLQRILWMWPQICPQ